MLTATPRQSPPPIVANALARAQELVDTRAAGPYQADWCTEAFFIGDATAVATVWLASQPTAV